MREKGKNKVKVAVIDMNKGLANQGMRGIQEILLRYGRDTGLDLTADVFDIRVTGDCPGLEYDIYISSGGPGSPYDGEGEQWEQDFFALLSAIEVHNLKEDCRKKHVFLICHSFQLACRKYEFGTVSRRKSNAFGIFPIHLTAEGRRDVIFEGLGEVMYSVDSRDWQVVEVDYTAFAAGGAAVLALEKERPHVALERCVMALRFTPEIVGTQFHPEADPVGIKMYLLQEEKKSGIIAQHGEDKYNDMLNSLDDPERIIKTQRLVLPNFLNYALELSESI